MRLDWCQAYTAGTVGGWRAEHLTPNPNKHKHNTLFSSDPSVMPVEKKKVKTLSKLKDESARETQDIGSRESENIHKRLQLVIAITSPCLGLTEMS